MLTFFAVFLLWKKVLSSECSFVCKTFSTGEAQMIDSNDYANWTTVQTRFILTKTMVDKSEQYSLVTFDYENSSAEWFNMTWAASSSDVIESPDKGRMIRFRSAGQGNEFCLWDSMLEEFFIFHGEMEQVANISGGFDQYLIMKPGCPESLDLDNVTSSDNIFQFATLPSEVSSGNISCAAQGSGNQVLSSNHSDWVFVVITVVLLAVVGGLGLFAYKRYQKSRQHTYRLLS
jgi:hypothetical protein